LKKTLERARGLKESINLKEIEDKVLNNQIDQIDPQDKTQNATFYSNYFYE
jgi:hypothetical protein